jgi:hypothetical protein
VEKEIVSACVLTGIALTHGLLKAWHVAGVLETHKCVTPKLRKDD